MFVLFLPSKQQAVMIGIKDNKSTIANKAGTVHLKKEREKDRQKESKNLNKVCENQKQPKQEEKRIKKYT